MAELKPCPFCGGKGRLSAKDHLFGGWNGFGDCRREYLVKVICNRCKARGGVVPTGWVRGTYNLHKQSVYLKIEDKTAFEVADKKQSKHGTGGQKMASEQLSLYDVPPEPPKKPDNQKRSWEKGFQRWSNESSQDERNPLGVCGYGSICDYCEDNTYGNPCVRALNAMCWEKRITIDYSKRNYEDIWDGRFEDGK